MTTHNDIKIKVDKNELDNAKLEEVVINQMADELVVIQSKLEKQYLINLTSKIHIEITRLK